MSGLGNAGLQRIEALETALEKVKATVATALDRSARAEAEARTAESVSGRALTTAEAASRAAGDAASVAADARVRAVASSEAAIALNATVTSLEVRVAALEGSHDDPPDDPEPPPAPPDDPPLPPSGVVFDLSPRPGFDPDNPVLKNGVALTGEARRAWDGLRWLIENHRTARYMPPPASTYVTLDEFAARDNTYHYGRTLGATHADLLLAYRLTGWTRILDELIRISDIQYAQLAVGYRGEDPDAAKYPASPYLTWRRYQNDSATHRGTTYHVQDAPLAHVPIAQIAIAAREAADLGSRYAAAALKWRAYLTEHFIPMWRGPETKGEPGWALNHKGNTHKYFTNSSTTQRAGVNNQPDWPLFSRQHTHTHTGDSALHLYLGTLLGDSTARGIGALGFRELFARRNLYRYEGRFGEAATWPRTLHYTGHGTEQDPSSQNYHQPTTYAGLVVMDALPAWLDGAWPDFPEAFARPVMRTIAEYAIPERPSGYAIAGDLAAHHVIRGVNDRGDVLTVQGSSFSARNADTVLAFCYPWLLAWDPDGSATEHFLGLLASSTRFTEDRSDPLARPRLASYPLGVIIRDSVLA